MTPSYNQAVYLEQTLTSVLEQDYPRLEYFVVDGASTDSSVEVIRKYADRLDWWVSEDDNGQAEAINKGLARASGEIVAWLNSDDYYLPGAILGAVQAFRENPDVVLVYGDMLAINESGDTINLLKYRQLTFQDLLCFQIIGQPAIFFRREAFENAGGLDSTYHYLLDHHLWLRIALHGRILHVDETWAAARYHPEAKNIANPTEFGREAFRIFDWVKTQPEFAEAVAGVENRARASAFRVNARYHLDGDQAWKSITFWFRALLIRPGTALERLNILGSALLKLIGLGVLREMYLKLREIGLRQR